MAPKGRDLITSVRSMFGDRGRSLDMAGAELLVQSAGKDLQRISVEIDKVVAYAGERTELTRDDIASVVAATAETSVFEFADAVAERDCVRALNLLEGLLRDGGSTVLSVHFIAMRTLRDLIAARSLLDRGQGSLADLSRALGRPDWQLKRLPKQARGFRSDELVALLKAAAKAEAEMKTSRDARLALERWVVLACRG
jgi:DNA polymerase-3 subunit delta